MQGRPPRKIVFAVLILSGIALCYFAFSKRYVDTIIARSETGESVVSMGPGWLRALDYWMGIEPQLIDTNKLRYRIEVIEYLDPTGKTLARFKPRLTPHDYAKAKWIERFVLITSGSNGECPAFHAFDRVTGEPIKFASEELRALPPDIQREFDPCGIGSDEYRAWEESQPRQEH